MMRLLSLFLFFIILVCSASGAKDGLSNREHLRAVELIEFAIDNTEGKEGNFFFNKDFLELEALLNKASDHERENLMLYAFSLSDRADVRTYFELMLEFHPSHYFNEYGLTEEVGLAELKGYVQRESYFMSAFSGIGNNPSISFTSLSERLDKILFFKLLISRANNEQRQRLEESKKNAVDYYMFKKEHEPSLPTLEGAFRKEKSLAKKKTGFWSFCKSLFLVQ